MNVSINNTAFELNSKIIGKLICELMQKENFVQGCKELEEEEVGQLIIAAFVLASEVAAD